MTSLNISLPESLREWIDTVVASGGYGNASEYLRELIRDDQKRREEERLEKLLLEGLDSGDPIEVTPEFWAKLRKDVVARAKELKAKQSGAA
ncbi:MAG: type II toxin-antitoxin system ParD family antitoxin [Candidatus Eisenbacteria bacterium]|nr:type II toxin-antitoxin system ParD family antitoxin [Candidatus Eisenbacteria bacterium]